VRLLADTHALLWWLAEDRRLSSRARTALEERGNEIYISAASAWEIATKSRKTRLEALPASGANIEEIMEREGFRPLSVTLRHGARAGSYSQPHADPFDRMLAAQCEIEGLTLVTRDPVFAAFHCPTLW
jgi:PIN domain nuclease of toxin-antitoxin system